MKNIFRVEVSHLICSIMEHGEKVAHCEVLVRVAPCEVLPGGACLVKRLRVKVAPCKVLVKRLRVKTSSCKKTVSSKEKSMSSVREGTKRVHKTRVRVSRRVEEEKVETKNGETKKSESGEKSTSVLVINPKSIQQRLANQRVLEKMNEGYEDDLFAGRRAPRRRLLDESMGSEEGGEGVAGEGVAEERARSPPAMSRWLGAVAATPESLLPRRASPPPFTMWQRAALLQRGLKARRRRKVEARRPLPAAMEKAAAFRER